jgi:hypothetical protein
METQQISIEHLHFDHQLWMNELRFFDDELKFYTNRLEDIAVRYSDRQIMAKVEQFQNKFIRQQEVLNELKHDIRMHEQVLAKTAESVEPLEVTHVEYHAIVQDKVDTFRKLYNELKTEYRSFVSEWL